MIGFLMGWWRARAARPLLWWVAGLLVYVTLPVPQQWVLALIVGLGVALTVTLARLREGGHRLQHSERAWELTHRLGNAVEDRIPGAHNQQGQVLHTALATIPHPPTGRIDAPRLLDAQPARQRRLDTVTRGWSSSRPTSERTTFEPRRLLPGRLPGLQPRFQLRRRMWLRGGGRASGAA